MKVMYVTDQVYRQGGAERILIQKLNYWASQPGDQAVLVTVSQRDSPPFSPVDPRVIQEDLAIDYVEGSSYYHPKNLRRIRRHFAALRTVVGKHRPDAVVVVSRGVSRFIAPFAAKGFRTFNEYHTSYTGIALQFGKLSFLSKIKKRMTWTFIGWVESRYTNVVFLNEEERAHYKRKNGVVIPNFFEPHQADPSVEKKRQAIALGRLSHEKGFDLLIAAWKTVHAAEPEWKMKIYGGGTEYSSLSQQIENAGLGNVVLLMGETADVQRVLAESAIYVMSSRTETFPMALLESLAAGVPVVTFDCPSGPRSILSENQDAIFAPAGDVAALADKILLLMRDARLRSEMELNARRNVLRFSRDIVMAQWRKLFSA